MNTELKLAIQKACKDHPVNGIDSTVLARLMLSAADCLVKGVRERDQSLGIKVGRTGNVTIQR